MKFFGKKDQLMVVLVCLIYNPLISQEENFKPNFFELREIWLEKLTKIDSTEKQKEDGLFSNFHRWNNTWLTRTGPNGDMTTASEKMYEYIVKEEGRVSIAIIHMTIILIGNA